MVASGGAVQVIEAPATRSLHAKRICRHKQPQAMTLPSHKKKRHQTMSAGLLEGYDVAEPQEDRTSEHERSTPEKAMTLPSQKKKGDETMSAALPRRH